MFKSRFLGFLADSLMMRRPMSRQKRLLGAALVFIILPSRASAQSPAFSTQTPESGVIGNTFVVLLPIFNTGSAEADNVQVASVTLGHATLTSPALPVSVGTLVPADHYEIHLQFDESTLVSGQKYLLSVRGTYMVGMQTFGFSVNRFLTVSVATGTVQTELRRWVVLDAVTAKFASFAGLDPTADNEELLAFLQSFPDFVDSGISTDTTSVWATFADGQALIIANDRPGPTNSGALISAATPVLGMIASSNPTQMALSTISPAAGPSPTELPQSSSFRLLNTLLGPTWDDDMGIGDITSSMSGNGYMPVMGADASVDSLKTVNSGGGEGVFYISSHGGFHAGAGVYSVWTTTKADDMTDKLLQEDVEPPPPLRPTLYYMLAVKVSVPKGQPKMKEIHYSFNNRFVETYFKDFAPNSFVYIDACHSNEAEAQDFKQAFFDKKAAVYTGWTGSINDSRGADTARLVFERLLGANKFCPEDGEGECSEGPAEPPVFAQRPFEWVSAAHDLPLHDLGFDPPDKEHPLGATIGFDPGGPGAFGLLAPSISNMSVDETKGQGQLTINGIFGQDPRHVAGGLEGDGVVTVGGPNSPVTIVSWTPNQLIVNLTLSGPGSSGDVQVVVRQHKSNVARLTEWQGTFQAVWAGNDSLRETINFEPAFRLDLRQYRAIIHYPPIEPGSILPIFFFPISSPVSTGNFACTGEGIYNHPGSSIDTFTWTGSGNLPLFQVGSASIPPIFFVAGGILMSHTAMSFSASAGSTSVGPCSSKEHIKLLPPTCDPSVQSCEGDTSGKVPLVCTGLPPSNMTLDSNTSAIRGNTLTLGNLSCDVDEPGPATASWNMIEPLSNTAPDPLSAR